MTDPDAAALQQRDVTAKVRFTNPDDESLPLTKCVCGATWDPWSGPILSIYADHPTECDACGRRFYFRQSIQVLEVKA